MSENNDLSSTKKLKAQGKGQTKPAHQEDAKAKSSQLATLVVPETSIEQESIKTETSQPTTLVIPETPVDKVVSLPSGKVPKKRELQKSNSPKPSRASLKQLEETQMLRTRCKQLGLSLLQEQGSARSLGFTSALQGEGKSFLAKLMAEALAEDKSTHVVLLECNWENPTFNSEFNLASRSGLAEWLQGKSALKVIRHQVTNNLTVIPAGEGKTDAIHLIRELQQRGIRDVLDDPNELLIVDLPAMVTTSYGQFAAQLVDALLLVVRMGVTPEVFVEEAHNQLKNLPVQGVVLNQIASRIPRWLRQIL